MKDYFAGIVDSDGNIDLSYRKVKNGFVLYPKITVAQTLTKILSVFKKEFNCGYVYNNIFEINGKKVYEFLPLIVDRLKLKYHLAKFIIDLGRVIFEKESEVKETIEKFRMTRYLQKENTSIDLNWLAGYIDGDGSFSCERSKYKLRFSLVITAHEKDMWVNEILLEKYGGSIRKMKKSNCVQWKLHLENNLELVEELIDVLKIKKMQCKLISNYLKKYNGSYLRKRSWDYEFVYSCLKAMKILDDIDYDNKTINNFISLKDENNVETN